MRCWPVALSSPTDYFDRLLSALDEPPGCILN